MLFLHRSAQSEEPQDTILHYLPPAVGFAVANWLGNPAQNQGLFSFLMVVLVAIYIAYSVRPLS